MKDVNFELSITMDAMVLTVISVDIILGLTKIPEMCSIFFVGMATIWDICVATAFKIK